MPRIHRTLATTAPCLAAVVPMLSAAAEWENHYPEEAIVVQGVSSQMTDALDEATVLYAYFAADGKIAYIEESFSTCTVAVCVRYLFDESGNFVAASTRISTQSALSEEWSHSQHLLTPGQLLKVERCRIKEAIDERAKRILTFCLLDIERQSKKTIK